MNSNVLKEYLVSLGFSVNEPKFNKAMGKMKGFEAVAGKVAGNIGKGMAKGSTIAVSAVVAVTGATVNYMDTIAKADMETEKFARRMWMTEQNARSLQSTLKAMGEDMGSIYDVAANPELRDQFFTLRNDANKYESQEVDKAMKEIRAVRFEWQRFQLLLSYGSRYVAYYLTKYLGEPMDAIKKKLKSVNDSGEKLVHKYGNKIAKWLSYVVRLFGAGVRYIGDFIGMIQKIPNELKAVAAAVGLVASMFHPVTAAIVLFGAFLLLLEDFYTWKDGGTALFSDLWEGLDEFQNKVANADFENDTLNWLIIKTGELIDNLKDLGTMWDDFKSKLDESDYVGKLKDKWGRIGETTADTKKDFGKFFGSLGGIGNGLKNFFTGGTNIANDAKGKATNQSNVNNDNKVIMTNHFKITGTDDQSIVRATANEIEYLTRRYSSGWADGRLPVQ